MRWRCILQFKRSNGCGECCVTCQQSPPFNGTTREAEKREKYLADSSRGSGSGLVWVLSDVWRRVVRWKKVPQRKFFLYTTWNDKGGAMFDLHLPRRKIRSRANEKHEKSSKPESQPLRLGKSLNFEVDMKRKIGVKKQKNVPRPRWY